MEEATPFGGDEPRELALPGDAKGREGLPYMTYISHLVYMNWEFQPCHTEAWLKVFGYDRSYFPDSALLSSASYLTMKF